MPAVNMSAAMPDWLNEAETIPVGALSFQQRIVQISKMGTGLKVSDEVQRYVSLNILSRYLSDVGIQMGLGLDTLAVQTLINGDVGTLSAACPVIGVDSTADGITYKDMVRAWLRMGQIGRMPQSILSNEEAALEILLLPEFKGGDFGTRLADIRTDGAIPDRQNYLIHGAMPAGNIIGLIDSRNALMKLNATGMLVESERIFR